MTERRCPECGGPGIECVTTPYHHHICPHCSHTLARYDDDTFDPLQDLEPMGGDPHWKDQPE